MDGFQPRIENPPESAHRKATKWNGIRDFVRNAKGQWCLILEVPQVKKKQRRQVRSAVWSALMRLQGYEKTGFELRFLTTQGTYKIYARFVEANVVKSSQ